MYILNGAKKEIVNSEFVERFCLAQKEDATLIVASYSANRPPVTISRYENVEEAKSALEELYCAISGGQACFTMPESRFYSAEHLKHDARTKRNGGS